MNELAAPALRPAAAPACPNTGATARTRVGVVDHLRSTLTLLVLLQHGVLAYNAYAPQPAADFSGGPMPWRAFPIVDAAKAPGIDVITTLNDTFFMALMFLVGGLFVAKSLAARGAAGYVRERALRLGLPFVVGAALLAPLAYYPAWLQHGGAADFGAYLQAYAALSVWPAGPAWFLWVLFAFGAIVALVHALAPRAIATLAAHVGPLGEKPLRFALALILVACAGYVPYCVVYDGMSWAAWGPFTVQSARVWLYFTYFAFGVAVGGYGLDRGLFAADGALARRWKRWANVAPVVFIVFVGFLIALFTALGKGTLGTGLIVSTSAIFVATGVVTSLAFVAAFARFAGRWTGAVWASLDRNAYGMYLVHYVFSAWLQYALLDQALSGWIKALVVFAGTVALSWATTAALRRIPAVARVI